MVLARSEVWKSFQSRLDSSKLKEVEQHKAEIESRLADLVTDLNVLDEKTEKESKRVKYTVRAKVNDALLETLLSAASGGSTASGEGSLFAFLFIPRMQSESLEFDATVTKKVKGAAARESKSVSQDQVAEVEGGVAEKSVSGEEVKVAVQRTTSGKTKRKAQEATWTVVESKGVDAEVNKVLTESGYESATLNDILAECGQGDSEALVEELVGSKTMRMSRGTTRMVTDALKECEARFLGLGYMDIDSIQKDSQSGGWLVRVSVNVKVKDYGPVLEGRRKIASTVATVQEGSSGIGRTQDEARDAALQDAGRQVASIIVSQMRAKNLR